VPTLAYDDDDDDYTILLYCNNASCTMLSTKQYCDLEQSSVS